jgi:NADH:ubiquinone oxidoreductase subunit H
MNLWSQYHIRCNTSMIILTLFERKVLSLPQYRVGPNKVSIKGVVQPVLDGIKLLSKDQP